MIEAFNWIGKKLLVIGDGPERKRLEALALDNIEFLGYVRDSERSNLFAKAQFVIVIALEDYGLVPIEANASGTPVIAYGKGGVLDTQIDGITGVFFERQNPESLHAALIRANKILWDYRAIREHAIRNFSQKVFFQRIDKLVDEVSTNYSTSLTLDRLTSLEA